MCHTVIATCRYRGRVGIFLAGLKHTKNCSAKRRPSTKISLPPSQLKKKLLFIRQILVKKKLVPNIMNI
jgi:hypothetical protein